MYGSCIRCEAFNLDLFCINNFVFRIFLEVNFDNLFIMFFESYNSIEKENIGFSVICYI